jgi:uncharacterized membrane protein
MVHLTPDQKSQHIAYSAVAFGLAALVFVCVGIGTPRWYSTYELTGTGGYVKTNSANFFYTCSVNQNGTTNNCTNRGGTLFLYPGYSTANLWMTDYYQRMQNAGGLCIVGIIFLFIGTLTTLIMAQVYFKEWITYVPPTMLFLATLFMVAGKAEGSRYLQYNDYSSFLTALTLFISAFAAGRIDFSLDTKVITD